MIVNQTVFSFCVTCAKPTKSKKEHYFHEDMKHELRRIENGVGTVQEITKGRIGKYYVETVSKGNSTKFLLRSNTGFEIKEYVKDWDKLFIPQNIDSVPYPPYADSSYYQAEDYEKEKLLDQIKSMIDKTLVISEDAKLFILAQILGSYCLDWMDAVHYLAFIGDISTGKSTILKLLQNLMYRPLYTTQTSDWQILKFLGTDEDCNGVILIDECQNIEKNRDLHDIFKQGYKKLNPISKNGKYYNTFSIYCLAGERLTDDRAIRDRTIPIYTVEGNPKIQLSKMSEECLNYLSGLRDKLLLWKLSNLTRPRNILKPSFFAEDKNEEGKMEKYFVESETEPIKLDISLTGRERELFEDYLLLLHGTKYYTPYKESVLSFLKIRQTNSYDTFEAKLWREIRNSLVGNIIVLSNLDHVIKSESFERPSRKKIVKIMKEKFGAIQDRTGTQRFYKFNSHNIESFDKKYGVTPRLSH